MAKRVFELARELDVTSKTVLTKCRAEGLEIKNHMSTVSAGLEATVREWFSESAGGTAVETTEHVDLAGAHKEAKKRRRRKTKKEIEAEAKAAAEQEQAQGETEADQAADTSEAVPEEPAESEVAVDGPVADEAASEQTETQPADQDVADAKADSTTVADEAAEDEQEEPDPSPPDEIRPAGPQVVPKPAVLKGPRVIRVDKPDNLSRPPARRAPRPVAGPTGGGEPSSRPARGRGGAAETSERPGDGKRKTKRRSPRRRGGRTADSGEKLKEWRNQDLLERSERLAAAGGGLRRHRPSVSRRQGEVGGRLTGPVEIAVPITVKSLSAATGVKVADILKKLLALEVMANINHVLDAEAVETVMGEYGIEMVIKVDKSPEDELLEQLDARPAGQLSPRAPVVTFLGHVDHGKTSLMDRIRNTDVTTGEAGGITQHIGAYRLDGEGTSVVFLDTPGHEAFTAMRSRGANMTDVVVLVVAADDGIMPQTVEAISHAKAAGVPIIVALNKIDVPNANVQRALGQLSENGLQPRQWGGDTEVIETSAITGEGVDSLVETLSLEAELLELKAETDAPASGYVVEAEIDPGLGVLTRLLVLNGTLKVGDVLLAGHGYGRVRSMRDHHGRNITEAGPATPVEVAGLDELPEAGDKFHCPADLDQARSVALHHREAARTKGLTAAPTGGLEALLSQIEAGTAHELAVIIKADVQGSIEAIVGSIENLGTEETKVKILHAAAGGVSSGDVTLAEASSAMVIGFNVVADSTAMQLAKQKGVDVRLYRVIYEVIEDVRDALEKGLAPEIREEVLGHAEIRQVFKISRVGAIAGCFATDGVVQRNAKVRVVRDQVVIEDDRALESLKRFKDDAREVRAGLECGLKIAGYNDIKEGDVLEFYQRIEVARTL